MRELLLETPHGIKIAINHYETKRDEVLIIVPGWFMTKDSRSFKDMAKEFTQSVDVIVMDPRGHGKSSGAFMFGAEEIVDLAAVVDFARERYGKVYLLGFSLGGGLVVNYAAENKVVNKVIAVSAPHSFEKIENQMWRPEAWYMTIFKKMNLKQWCSIRPHPKGLFAPKPAPIKVVDKVEAPTLFIAGEKDPTVHAWHTEALYDKAVCEKQYKLFEKCFHAEDLFLQKREEFIDVCKEWLK